jgi:hypothetical protein
MCVGIQAYDQYVGHSKKLIERREFHSDRKRNSTFRPEIGGSNVNRYIVKPAPDTWVSYGKWLAHPRDPWFFQDERIVIREITGVHPRRIVGAIIDDDSVPYKSVLVVKLSTEQLIGNLDHYSLLAILNSTFTSWVLPFVANKQEKKVFPRVSLMDLKKLPIAKSLNLTTQKSLSALSRKQVIHCKKHGETSVALDREIDQHVYSLYGLTPDEIKVVENASR